MSIFDIGRPTGYAGGNSFATNETLNQDAKRINNRTAQAEFFDYMDAQKSRMAAYDLKETVARSGIRQQDSLEKSNIATNKLTEGTANKDTKQLPRVAALDNAKMKEDMRQIYRATNKDQLADISKLWFSSQEAVKKGMPKQQVYKAAREEMLGLAKNKEKALARMDRFDIGSEFTEERWNKLMFMSSYAGHTDDINKADHQAQHELEILKNTPKTGGGKPANLEAKQYTPDEMKKLGAKVSTQVAGFARLEGSYDEDNKIYTKSQGALIATVADLAEQATVLQKNGEDVLKGDIEFMATDMLNSLPDEFMIDDYGANTFQAYKFDGVARVAMQRVLEERAIYGQNGTGKSPSFIDVWNALKPELLLSIKRVNTK